ncbi:MAG TPA: DUF3617 domain-containing protein [Terriglobales bacterium]
MKRSLIHSLSLTIAMLMTFFAVAVGAQNQKSAKNANPQAAQPAGVKLQPMNVKPGLWETTTTITVAGEMPIPAEVLNRLTPEQRARMEARMKANSNGHTNTDTHKSCVTKEDVENQRLHLGDNSGCTQTILSSTSTSAKANISCEVQGMTGNGTYEVEALDPEHIKGASHATMTGNGQTRNVDGKFTSQWLGASCEGVK